MSRPGDYQKYLAYYTKRRATPEYKERARLQQQTYRQRLRDKLVDALGGCCIKCGFADPRALQVDHVNGGGNKEFRQFRYKAAHYIFILKHIKSGKYQLLCANCNWIKKSERNET